MRKMLDLVDFLFPFGNGGGKLIAETHPKAS